MRLAPPSPPGPVTDDSGRHRSTPPNAARGHVRVHAALAPHGSVHHAMPCHMPCQRDSDAPRSRPPPSLCSTPPVPTLAPAKLGRPCLVPDGSRPSRRRTGRRERWDWMKWSMPCNWPPAPSDQRPATSKQPLNLGCLRGISLAGYARVIAIPSHPPSFTAPCPPL